MSEENALESAARIVADPPASEMRAGETDRITVGAPSSSVRVRTAPVTEPTPSGLEAVPATVGVRSTSSASLSTAVTVTVSAAFAVAPAGMVIVASLPTVYAPDTGEIVIVVAASEATPRVAETRAVPPFSETAPGDTDRVTSGGDSSSVVLTDTSRGPSRPYPGSVVVGRPKRTA